MVSKLVTGLTIGVLLCGLSSPARAVASTLYTWDNTGFASGTEEWIRNFGAANTSATLSGATFGTLTITETSAAGGGAQAFSDAFNRVRESSTASSGGLDLTGRTFLQFDVGHNGSGPVNVQFFVQASTATTFVALGPDVAVSPGVNTYQVPITGLTADQLVYVRTIGMNVRDHAAQGNLTWSLNEVRSGNQTLTQRILATFDTGTAEGGLQGMIVNFDTAAVLGNNGGQNQTGLSHNPAGSGSIQWTDQGGQNGAAVSIGNGTAWSGNTFNNRTTDLSDFDTMLVRISVTDLLGGDGDLAFNAFFQKDGFQFQAAEGGAGKLVPIDGQFHDVFFSLAGLTNMEVVEQTGFNFFSHPQDLIINIDLIRFDNQGTAVPEPATSTLMLLGVLGLAAAVARRRCGSRRVNS